MTRTILLILLIYTPLSVTTVVAGNCSCASQIDNASAEVSGSCSKVWSNNHCTLKEDGATTRGIYFRDKNAAISSLGDQLSVSGFFSLDEVDLLTNIIQDVQFVSEVTDQCLNQSEITQEYFDAYVSASLISIIPNANVKLLVSDELFSLAIQAGREFSVANSVCRNDILTRESFDSSNMFYGAGCFAFGTADEHFAISFSPVLGCPNGLEF